MATILAEHKKDDFKILRKHTNERPEIPHGTIFFIFLGFANRDKKQIINRHWYSHQRGTILRNQSKILCTYMYVVAVY